ncbi:hypothetical protein [Nocardia wallacei]|uniref:hypothetical protein n=1 Tax=Nocardia wallacei TaxID=480035 RepID=UPI0024556659|nr:hypothetical protein [Nocardia wallacei]
MTVRLTPRDMLAMTVLADHYGAPSDLVAEMLGISMPTAYGLVRRWRAVGMVSKHDIRPVPGPRWVFPTRSTTEMLLGFPVQPWRPTPKMAAHVTAVLRVRLALVGMDLDRWISERRLRSESGTPERGRPRPHIHDGRYVTKDGSLYAIEVELTKKSPSNALAAIDAAYEAAEAAECETLLYYCRDEDVRKTVRKAGEMMLDINPHRAKRGPVSVRAALLEELLGDSSANPRPSLRVIDGGATEQAAL